MCVTQRVQTRVSECRKPGNRTSIWRESLPCGFSSSDWVRPCDMDRPTVVRDCGIGTHRIHYSEQDQVKPFYTSLTCIVTDCMEHWLRYDLHHTDFLRKLYDDCIVPRPSIDEQRIGFGFGLYRVSRNVLSLYILALRRTDTQETAGRLSVCRSAVTVYGGVRTTPWPLWYLVRLRTTRRRGRLAFQMRRQLQIDVNGKQFCCRLV